MRSDLIPAWQRLWRGGVVLSIALLLAPPATARAADPSVTLWFDKPATRFQQSLPLGNGRIGAMVFGGVTEERIVLNESSVWSGSREDADRPDAHRVLPEIRRLLLEGQNVEAERLVNANFTCQGRGSGHGRGANVPFGCYQTLGNLRLKFGGARGGPALRCGSDHRAGSDDQEIQASVDGDPAPQVAEIALDGVAAPPAIGQAAADGYSRTLDLRTGLAEVVYQEGGVRFTREHFVSAPDEVFVSRLAADSPGALSFTALLDRPERFETSASADNELLMTGTLNDGRDGRGVSYAARLRVLARGGVVRREGHSLVVEQADEVLLLLAAATDFQGFAGRQLEDPVAATQADLDRAGKKSFEELRAAQRADHLNYTGQGAGTYANLFDACPPFQIDGNFGGCAGIAEMLVQSHADEIELLPALPQAWPAGRVRGLCARGGFEVDIAWQDGRLEAATVRSKTGTATTVRYRDRVIPLKLQPGESQAIAGH
jgi:alpha-L-fucosidase 2